jgi:hypothetical protein
MEFSVHTDGVVGRFEHEGGFVDPARDQVTVHGLADEVSTHRTSF